MGIFCVKEYFMESDVNRLYVVIFALSIIVKAVYSAFEFAIVEVNDNKVKSLAENNHGLLRFFKNFLA